LIEILKQTNVYVLLNVTFINKGAECKYFLCKQTFFGETFEGVAVCCCLGGVFVAVPGGGRTGDS
jgi:hypothetical protein